MRSRADCPKPLRPTTIESLPDTNHMNDMKNALIRSAKAIAKELLGERGQMLFLPSRCDGLTDSEYEPYLGCALPESLDFGLFSGVFPHIFREN